MLAYWHYHVYSEYTNYLVQKKKLNTVKAATFGSELVTLRICKYFIVVLRYKLRVFGVILEGPAYVVFDNCGVVKNMSILELLIHKKQNVINYHSVHE